MSRIDAKEFLDLLLPFKSDETKKARRNVSIVGFVVVSAWLLKVRIVDVKVLGIDLSRSHEITVLIMELALLSYWTSMFVLSWHTDKEIQKERSRFLEAKVSALLSRLKEVEDIKKRNEGKSGYIPNDYAEVKAGAAAYEDQKARTGKASLLARVLGGLEFYVPIALAGLSICIILAGITVAL